MSAAQCASARPLQAPRSVFSTASPRVVIQNSRSWNPRVCRTESPTLRPQMELKANLLTIHPQMRLMSRFSRTGFGKPRVVTLSMARPKHSVVVTRCSHCILERGEQFPRGSEGACGNGATGSLADRMSAKFGTQVAHWSAEKASGTALFD
jgi:hypothetical protein